METKPLTEQEEIYKTRAGLRLMKVDVVEIRSDITSIKTALIGSEIGQDGGLVKRMYENESRVDKMDIRIGILERNDEKKGIYIKILWTIAGAILGALVVAITTHYIK